MKADNLYPFVARERELAWLNSQLDQALQGHGRVCFIAGEAGAGKTALVSEFTRRAQQDHGDIVVGIGECNAQTGVADAYLPFREMLRLLTGDADADQTHPAATAENASRLKRFLRISGEALVESGPDLVGIFIPGGSLLARLGAKLVEQTPALARLQAILPAKADAEPLTTVETLQQSQIFEQYTNVLRGIANSCPLLLILDDLHWADEASLSLLFHLGRRIEDSRIMVVGNYRPNDVALGRGSERHPLVPVLNELQRHYGENQYKLAGGGAERERSFVDALIDAQPNKLDEAFRAALWELTRGHPLFVVELLRRMQQAGALLQDEQGQWTAGPEVRWDLMPARVEGVIEERVGRITGESRVLLNAACVEGEQFTAEVLAVVCDLEVREVIRRISGELEKQHELVSAQGVLHVGARRVSTYRFRHNLFHAYLYGGLDEVERSYLHEDVGRALEALYGGRTDEVAVRLAHHFEEAGDLPKAIGYRQRAGCRAQRQFAHAEAALHYRHALQLLGAQTGESGADHATRALELTIREALADVLALTGRGDDARAALAAVLEALPVEERLAAVRLHRKVGDSWMSQHQFDQALAAFELAERGLGGEIDHEDRESVSEWLHIKLQRMWVYYFQHRDLSGLAERVRPVIDRHGTPAQKAQFCHYSALGLLRLARYEASDEIMSLAKAGLEASEASRQLGSLATSHYLLGACQLDRRSVTEAEAHLRESCQLARRAGALPLVVPPLTWLAVAHRLQGRVGETRSTAAEALALAEEIDNPTYIGLAQLTLAWVAWREGRFDEAGEIARRELDRVPEGFPFRWHGEWPLLGVSLREGRLEDAVEHARRMLGATQQKLPDELEAGLGKAVRCQDEGDSAAARKIMAAMLPVAMELGCL